MFDLRIIINYELYTDQGIYTFPKKENLKRKDITKQVSRGRNDGVSLEDVESFKGVKLND